MIVFLLSLRKAAALSLALPVLLAGCATNHAPPVVGAKSSAPATNASSAPSASTTSAGSVSAPGSLFDGKTLAGWTPSDFSNRGEVKVENGEIKLGLAYMTGITWTNTNTLPRMDYEISLDAKRVDGSDFFCGLTFPVGTNVCSLIVGGWGGGVVGLSSLDSEDASQNETTTYMNFVNGKWYHIRVRVEPERIQAWIDDEKPVINVETKERRISIRLEMEACVPLGVATWNTAAALKNIQLKKL